MEGTENRRDFGLDLVRAAAGVLTLSVHFFLNSGFYDAPVSGGAMLAACVARMLCMTCVPLFLLLTGYTCIGRVWSKRYYWKLLPVLLTYALAGAACVAFRILWLGERWPLRTVALMFTTYGAAPYGWYIEMYIGLFLLSPFFNAAWHALGREGRGALTLTLVGLTALPPLVNQLWELLPDWWVGMYPLAFYAVGAWLRENPVRVKGRKLLLCWLGLAVAFGIKSYVRAGGGAYALGVDDGWGSLGLLAQAVCLFSALRRAEGERVPAPARWWVARAARLALPMYLVSYIVDRLIYPVLAAAAPEAGQRIFWMWAVVPVVTVCSMVLAQLVDWASGALVGLVPMRTKDAVHAQGRDTKES